MDDAPSTYNMPSKREEHNTKDDPTQNKESVTTFSERHLHSNMEVLRGRPTYQTAGPDMASTDDSGRDCLAEPAANTTNKDETLIIICTYNMQGFNSNKIGLHKLLESQQIICIQEHWLYTFENSEIGKMSPDFAAAAKSNDHNDNITPQERTRGHGGVAIMWHNDLDKYTKKKKTVDGNNRTNCILLESGSQQLCIINVYMPCRNTHTGDDFEDTLSQLQEIMTKYRPTHHILICGDLNASLHRTPPNQQDKLLERFCKEEKLVFDERLIPEDTFQHHNGLHTAKLDYILCGIESKHLISEAKIHHQANQLNVSDHQPLTCRINVSTSSKNEHISDKPVHKGKPNWKKCDLEIYRNTLKQKLQDTKLESNSLTEITLKLDHFNSTIQEAEKAAFSNKNKSKRKNNTVIWTPAIKEAAGKMKVTTRKWKIAGSPLKPTNELNISRKESKKDFRSLQRQQQAVKRRELYQEITNTHADEQKIFYKLVNHQRKTTSKETDYITVDNTQFLSTENFIEGWQLYFEILSEPKDDPRFIGAYEDQVLEDLNIIEDICTNMDSNIDPISQDHLIEIINNMKRGKAADYAGITAEHFLNAMEEVAPYLTMIVNAILQKREIPPSLKTGILTPILKKGKDKTLPTCNDMYLK